MVEVVDQAGARVRDFSRRPRLPVRRLLPPNRGGRERGIAVLNRAVMLSPHSADPVIAAAHELTHVEMHEGLAVLAGDDPRYLAPTGDYCLVRPRPPMPATLGTYRVQARRVTPSDDPAVD